MASQNAEDFIADLSLQELFRDKDTGLALTNGTVEFFEDANRLIQKPVYKYTGSPGNPAFTALANPLTLNSAGMAEDGGDPVAIYYNPVNATTGDTELYYVEVKNDTSVLQNTREAWPPGFVQSSGGREVSINYIPNGQFAAWAPLDNTIANDPFSTSNPLNVAPGNWQYFNSAGTTDVNVTFNSFGMDPVPEGTPKNYIEVDVITSDPSDLFRDLWVYFSPVNTFQSDTEEYTYSFWARSDTGSNATIQLYLEKVYGTGGSPNTTELLTSFDVSTSWQQFTHTFIFGDDSGKTLGTGESQVRLALRAPLLTTSRAQYTNFILSPGTIAIPLFPETTDNQARISSMLAELAPAQDQSNIYLPVRLGRNGLEFDTTEVGKIYSVMRDPELGELPCDGASFRCSQLATNGIPFSRLFNVIGNRFGNGLDFVTTYYFSNAETNHLTLSTNENAAVAAPANVSANLTVTGIHTSSENVQFYAGRPGSANELRVVGKNFGSFSGGIFGAGTSGFTVSKLEGNDIFDPINDTTGNSRFGYRISLPAIPGAGSYFQFASLVPGGTNFYVWFKIDGGGADPAPGGTGILLDILTAVDTTASVTSKLALLLNSTLQHDLEWSALPAAGGYWTFDTTTTNYYVWYTVDGAGADPAVGGRTGIQVDMLSADTTTEVALKTQGAINSFKFAVPDLRGLFLRGFDPNNRFDNASERFNYYQQNLVSTDLGTEQWPQQLSHSHEIFGTGFSNTNVATVHGFGGGGLAAFTVTNIPTSIKNVFSGGRDVTPWNMACNYVIKY